MRPIRSLGWICQVASFTMTRAPNSKVTFCRPANMGANLAFGRHSPKPAERSRFLSYLRRNSPLMKKFILLVIVFIAAGFLAYKLLSEKPVQPAPPKDEALRISKNPETFNVAFDSLLSQYFAVRDALVNWDTLTADRAAYGLAAKDDSLPIRQIKADTGIILTARS